MRGHRILRGQSLCLPDKACCRPATISITISDEMKPVVTIYTKKGCHLCDVAKENILAAADPKEFALEEIDIETDEQLFARYRYDIPVVLINGVKAFKHSVDAKEFKRKLKRLGAAPWGVARAED